jgi:hypothetical protein
MASTGFGSPGTKAAYEKYRAGGDVEAVKVVLFDHILHELPEIKRFLKECGVDRVIFRADIHARGTGDGKSRPRSCFWLYLGMLVRPDGTFYPRCVRRGRPAMRSGAAISAGGVG